MSKKQISKDTNSKSLAFKESQKNKTNDTELDENEDLKPGLSSLASKTAFFAQIASISSSTKSEPLPYTDYSLFEDKYDISTLNVNKNPFLNHKIIFLPNTPITVKVTAIKKSRRHILHPYIYVIKLKHGKFEWEVSHDYKEIKELHRTLAKIVKSDIGRSCSDIPKDEIKSDWPQFPDEYDHLVPDTGIVDRCKNFETYLERLLRYPPFRDHPQTIEFLFVSPVSFLNDLSPSFIEDYVQKHTYEHFYTGHFGFLKKACSKNFKLINYKRWFCLKDTYILYLNPSLNNTVTFVMLVDGDFQCEMKIKAGAYHAIEIKNLRKFLVLKFRTSQSQKLWYDKIMHMLNNSAKFFHDPSLLRYDSFAPVRSNQLCKWYVNGALYMEHVMDAINNAKEEIFITDWCLSPELFLKRPSDDLQYRLDKILLKKSREDVKIYILIYKEVELVTALGSERAAKVLTQIGKNPNIKLIRHPKNVGTELTLWSHHEKFVIVDQTVAFIGGIDLCYGRWDDDHHRLFDLGNIPNVTDIDLNKNKRAQLYKYFDKDPDELEIGVESGIKVIVNSSALTCDLTANLQSNTETKIEETVLSFNRLNSAMERPLSSEITEKSEKNEPTTERLKNKLKQIKKNIKEKTHMDDNSDRSSSSDTDSQKIKNFDEIEDRKIDESEIGYKSFSESGYYWHGKDYANAYKEDVKDLHDFSRDQFDRTEVPRMPWRDEALVVIGEAARDLARHFIHRWNHAVHDLKLDMCVHSLLIPKSYSEPIIPNYGYFNWFKSDLYKCSVQITRSLDLWSGGIYKTESSILNAYYNLIDNSKHYIYIENQFFVTSCKTDNVVLNKIGACLVDRIIRAHKKREKFRVFVVLPLLPGFDKLNPILAVQYYNLRSINLGEYSIYKNLINAGIEDPSEYITFHGMRNWSVLMGKLVQEIIYVHSKLMIVDDKHVICGSANINDRSMLGKRDSETAAVITDEEFVDSVLNGQNVKVGKYAFSLREKIFKLHLGIYFSNPNRIDIKDCVCDEFYVNFKKVSRKNTIIYDDVFKCLPSDNITDLKILKDYPNRRGLSNSDPIKAKEKLENEVMGYIVDFPLNFLCNEKFFFPNITTKEGLAPYYMWT